MCGRWNAYVSKPSDMEGLYAVIESIESFWCTPLASAERARMKDNTRVAGKRSDPSMKSHRNPDQNARQIDYCLNILRIRVWEAACQLIAQGQRRMGFYSAKWTLPINIPSDQAELKDVGTDTLRLNGLAV
jgi:hypothetical protein